MKYIAFLLFISLFAPMSAQAESSTNVLNDTSRKTYLQKQQVARSTTEANAYLAGAVPEENGQVVFRQAYTVPGKTRDEIYNALKQYLSQVLKRPNALPASRITAAESAEGTLAATLHETLWFKRSAWVSDFATVICQLAFEVHDGGYTATLRNIRYQYNALSDSEQAPPLKAEDWITDKEALTKNGTKLTRVGGKKLRVKTIDFQKSLFNDAATASGASPKTL